MFQYHSWKIKSGIIPSLVVLLNVHVDFPHGPSHFCLTVMICYFSSLIIVSNEGHTVHHFEKVLKIQNRGQKLKFSCSQFTKSKRMPYFVHLII